MTRTRQDPSPVTTIGETLNSTRKPLRPHPVDQLPELNAVGVGGGRHLDGSRASIRSHDVEVVHTGLSAVVVLLHLQAQRRRDQDRNHLLLTAQFSHATTVPAGCA